MRLSAEVGIESSGLVHILRTDHVATALALKFNVISRKLLKRLFLTMGTPPLNYYR
jgi:hypothetical protein